MSLTPVQPCPRRDLPTQNPKIKTIYDALPILFRNANVMENIVNRVHIGNYVAMATLCSFRLLFRSRSGLALLYP